MHVRSLVFRNRAPRAWLARRGTRLIAGRARQHVNPLSAHFQQPCEPPQWDSVFTDLTKPLFIDVGCAYGSYSVAYAKTFPDWNVLGLEIREAVLTMSKASTKAEQCPNLHFVATNANVSLPSLLDSMPPELRTRRVALLHPDPWFKKRHQKRRVLTPELLDALESRCDNGLQLMLQTDVPMLMQDLREVVLSRGRTWQGTLQEAWPVPLQTAREKSCRESGIAVFRCMYELARQ